MDPSKNHGSENVKRGGGGEGGGERKNKCPTITNGNNDVYK
jgi:hypothetical protein